MPYDDEFFVDDEDLGRDNQPSLVEEAQIKLLDQIEKYAREMKMSLKLKEKQSTDSALRILSSYLDTLIELTQINTEELQDSEIEERVNELILDVMKRTTVITAGNIDDILGKKEEIDTETEEDEDTGFGF